MDNLQIIYREEIPAKQAYSQLFATTGWNREYQTDASRLHQALSKSWHAVSAYDGDRLVGFGRVISDGVLYAFICDMIVLPSYQRQGIGSTILHKLIERCRGAGVPVVWLFAAQGKAGFYQAHGFAPRPADAPGMQLVAVQEQTTS